jgi:putative membrane protein
MTRISILSVACMVAVQGGLACASTADDAPMAGGGGTAGIDDGSPSGTAGASGASGAVLTMAEGLNDPEMLHVIKVTSEVEVNRARLAEARAQNAAVRTFASKLVRDHTIIAYSAAVTANTMGLAPATSEVASMVTTASDAFLQGMNAMPRSADFDRRFMDVQIESDKGKLALVERMLAHAEGVPLRSLMAEELQALQRHLDEGALIRFTLE